MEVLGSNLEDLRRLSGIVHDMLFLSHADRGAKARRTAPISLASLATMSLTITTLLLKRRISKLRSSAMPGLK